MGPTASPTSAGPWDADFVGLKADFAAANTIELEYHVGVGRDFRIDLYKKGCAARINTTLYDTSSVTTPLPFNASYQELKVTHGFMIAAITQSDVWNASSSK